jgi:dihydrolipoamide dehydrogenase
MYDCIIIGGGPSGISAGTRISQLGGKVVIIEKDRIGGVCTNWGCIPTKAMLASAKSIHDALLAERLGVTAKVSADFRKVIFHRDEQVKASQEHNLAILKSHGVEVIIGEGLIKDKNTVIVNNNEYGAKNIIICTGSDTKSIPGINFNSKIISSKELVTIRELPRHLVIIGGGVIGLEFASIFAHLGSKVTIIEAFDRLLYSEDAETGDAIKKALEEAGVQILLSTKVDTISQTQVITRGKKISYDKTLIAIGRYPLIDAVTCSRLGIQHDKTGIRINDRMQTSVKNIYAIGDATGKSVLAHVGQRQGIIAAEAIMGKKTQPIMAIPRCVYSIPEIACVGKTESQAKNPTTATFPLSYNAKAMLEGTTEGFIKVIMEGKRIVGFQMVGLNVTELVHEAGLIIENNISPEDVMKTIHAHPTVGESIKLAVQKAMGECVDIPKGA